MAAGGAGDVGDSAASVHNHSKRPGRGPQLQGGVEVSAPQTRVTSQLSPQDQLLKMHAGMVRVQALTARDKGAITRPAALASSVVASFFVSLRILSVPCDASVEHVRLMQRPASCTELAIKCWCDIGPSMSTGEHSDESTCGTSCSLRKGPHPEIPGPSPLELPQMLLSPASPHREQESGSRSKAALIKLACLQ